MKPAALGVILDSTHRQILLIMRKDVPVWVLPGGGIEPNESPENAVIREIVEETGTQIKVLKQCAEYFPINRLTTVTHIFLCEFASGTLQLSDETSAIAFFPMDSLPTDLFFLHREWIKDALAPSNKSIKKPITQVTYLSLFLYLCKHPARTLRYLWTRMTKD